jgi:hypothetical protein
LIHAGREFNPHGPPTISKAYNPSTTITAQKVRRIVQFVLTSVKKCSEQTNIPVGKTVFFTHTPNFYKSCLYSSPAGYGMKNTTRPRAGVDLAFRIEYIEYVGWRMPVMRVRAGVERPRWLFLYAGSLL